MNSSALRDTWALVLQVEKLKISQVTIYHEILEGSHDFLIYNTFDKIIRRNEENVTVPFLWTSKLLTCMFNLSRNFDNCDQKTTLKLFGGVQTNKHKFYSN